MKISIFLLALFHLVLMVDQDPVPPKYNIHNARLCIGDVMKLGNKTIKFNKVVSDSRCPKDVTCIWAGEVKVLVEFYEDGEFKGERIISGSNISVAENEITSASNISIAGFFDVESLDINYVVVTPYPEVNYKISQEEYSVELKVSEALGK